jgi:hypothetical protein
LALHVSLSWGYTSKNQLELKGQSHEKVCEIMT